VIIIYENKFKMLTETKIFTISSTLFLTVIILAFPSSYLCITDSERLELKLETEDMFFHGFNAYMQVAWPADELMPLSCKGRYRGREISRGDIDDALGNFSLTLIDSLDMLAVLGQVDLFEDSVLKVVETVSFDTGQHLFQGYGALSAKMLLVRIIKNNRIDAYFRSG